MKTVTFDNPGMVLVPRENLAQIGFAIDNLIDFSSVSVRRDRTEMRLLKAMRRDVTRLLATAPSEGESE